MGVNAKLCVFARAPEPGKAKTRLAPVLGDEGAASLAAAFLHDVVATCAELSGVETELWVAGDREHTTIAEVASEFGVPTLNQRDGDLGDRLAHAFEYAMRSAERVVIIGSDSPTLSPEHLRRAFDALEHAELALGPASDGGYYLIAARDRGPVFDGVRWSSRTTLQDTLEVNNARPVEVLSPWYDVDTPASLRVLRAHLALDPGAAPRTATRVRNL